MCFWLFRSPSASLHNTCLRGFHSGDALQSLVNNAAEIYLICSSETLFLLAVADFECVRACVCACWRRRLLRLICFPSEVTPSPSQQGGRH